MLDGGFEERSVALALPGLVQARLHLEGGCEMARCFAL
jgi:hypothetical protein